MKATAFKGVEDVEISPKDGKIYFTNKNESRTYRFKDDGNSVSNFETFVGGTSYKVTYGDGTALQPWGGGNDNLTFDDKGNLYVLQDGGRNHLWFVSHDHTQANPKVDLFLKSPLNAEPTGMTFSPDYKFMFISFQHPNTKNTAPSFDAQGNPYVFNKSTTVVIARKENLDGGPITAIDGMEANKTVAVFPNPADKNFSVAIRTQIAAEAEITMTNSTGQIVKYLKHELTAGSHSIPLNHDESGVYFLKVSVNGKSYVEKVIIK